MTVKTRSCTCVVRQNVTRESDCSCEGEKQQKLEGQMTHTLEGQNSLHFIRYYYDVQKGFCPVFGEELLLTEIEEKST